MGAINYEFEYDLDDPRRTLAHREIIRTKPFLRKVYLSWYKELLDRKNDLPEGGILEIGSGGGFLKEVMPEVITSDILELEHCDMIFSAEEIPLEDDSLSAIFMINVLHHIPIPEKFFNEADRLLKKGGMIIMIEPANTMLARYVYKNYHHEPFDENAGWQLSGSGPMSDSNQAMPWIILERDRVEFEKKFPALKVRRSFNHSPFRYIVSGGVSRKNLLPTFMYPVIRAIEWMCTPFNNIIGLFQTTIVHKQITSA